MSGRRAGFCAGYNVPGYANPGFGMGLGRAFGWRGGGRGWRHRFYATGLPGWARYAYGPAWDVPPVAPRMTREQEKDWLKVQAEDLQEMLQDINERISELEKE
jgi:hypothetical protein